MVKSEDAAVPTIHERVASGSTIHADEAPHWDQLHARYLTKRINHSQVYSDGESCTNQAESFFSRLRRAEFGTWTPPETGGDEGPHINGAQRPRARVGA